jgi:hypothetical protein
VKIREVDNEYEAIALLGYPTRGAIHINSYGTTTIRMDGNPSSYTYFNAGNVGIGTASPDEKLHVNGNFRLNGTFEDKDGQSGSYGQVLASTASGTDWITLTGDNLGNHTATQNLNMAAQDISGLDEIIGNFTLNTTSPYDLTIEEYSNEPIVKPTTPNFGYLGNETNYFYKIYSNYFYAGSSGNYLSYSDRRLKENIRNLDSSLEKILLLKPVLYDLKATEETNKNQSSENADETRKNQMGFIAQDLECIYPKLVSTNETTGIKSIAYQGLIAPMVNAIQELVAENTKLKNQLQIQEEKVQMLEKQLQTIDELQKQIDRINEHLKH